MKYFYRASLLAVFAAAILFSGSTLRAQSEASESFETLSKPVVAPSDSGLYKGINEIPASIRRSAPFARAFEEMAKRAGNSGTFDMETRMKAFEQSQRDLLKSSEAAEKSSGGGEKPLSDAWTNIGLNGSANNGIYSAGCTSAIAIDPTNTSIIYAGATSGGVWKTTDQGAHWLPLTDNVIPNGSVASIAIDPKNHNTIYVGTGNGYASIDQLIGTGLYKSTDGGSTWSHIGTSSLTGTIVKVFVDPVHTNIVLASPYNSNRGVFRSTDYGATWTKVYNAAQPVWDIVGGRTISSTPLLYFVEGNDVNSSSSEPGVYKSVNEGASWAKITGTALPPGNEMGRCAIAASVQHPERIFVLITNLNGDEINSDSALYRSTNDGLSWSSMAIPSTVFGPGGQPPQGWYDCMLAVSPNSAAGSDTMVIGGVEAYINYSDGSGWNAYCYTQTIWNYAHVDHHSFAFDPVDPTIMYDGDDGGLYWSQDAGYASDVSSGYPQHQSSTWSYRSNGMVTNRIYHESLNPNPSDPKTALVGLQDQGTWTLNYPGTSTVLLYGGDGMQPINNSYNTEHPYYAELPNGLLFRNYYSTTTLDSVYVTSDDANWDSPVRLAITSVNGASNNHVLYQGRSHLWLTTNDGIYWSAISPAYNRSSIDLAHPYIEAIGLSQVSASDIYIGLTGEIAVTTNGGSSWTNHTSGLPLAMVTSIVTTGRNPNFALASFYTQTGHRVMRSTDKGSTWADVSGTGGSAPLPQVGVNCVALDSIAPERIWYAATDNGIYYTIDSGKDWSVAGSGMGLVACTDVEVQANKSTIRVATFGRGIWQGATNTLPVELAGFGYQKIETADRTGTVLSWHTDSEHGSAYFVVERSIDGAAFVDLIPSVPSQAAGGNSNSELDYSFFDSTHTSGDYIYQLKQVDLDGSIHYSNSVELHWGTSGLIVSQNYPNPFVIGTPQPSTGGFNPLATPPTGPIVSPWPETRIHYELPDADVVTLKIYNAQGSVVRTLLNQVQQQPGDPDAFWDGKDDAGNYCASGTYFYVVQTQHYGTVVNKMILISN